MTVMRGQEFCLVKSKNIIIILTNETKIYYTIPFKLIILLFKL